jgi:hypothetical protein
MSSRDDVAATKKRSRKTAPGKSLGSRRIATKMEIS